MPTEITTAHLTADIVVLARCDDPHVLLIRRRWQPYQDHWAIPGGYLDKGETFVAAAARELREETGLGGIGRLVQVGIYDDPGRDPRGRVVTVAHAVVLPDMPAPRAGDDAREAQWVPVHEALEADLAFDHSAILRDALRIAKLMTS